MTDSRKRAGADDGNLQQYTAKRLLAQSFWLADDRDGLGAKFLVEGEHSKGPAAGVLEHNPGPPSDDHTLSQNGHVHSM